MRFARADPQFVDDPDDGWFDEFSQRVDEIIAVRLMMDDVAAAPAAPAAAGTVSQSCYNVRTRV